jgi:hypothetical protein
MLDRPNSQSARVVCDVCGLNVRRKRFAQRFCSPRCGQAALRSRKAAHALRSVTQGADTEKRHATILKAIENQPVTRSKKQGRGSVFSVPVNVLGGDRQQWSGARLLEPALCHAIVHCEIGGKLVPVPEMARPT